MSLDSMVLQGFEDIKHIDAFAEMLTLDNKKRVIASVAFAVEAGAMEFVKVTQSVPAQTEVMLGIGNGVTSYQALVALIDAGVAVSVLDTGSASVLFHPKLYAVESENIAKVMVGSANMTLGGLGNNFEASAIITFDLTKDLDCQTYKGLLRHFDRMSERFPNNWNQVIDETAAQQLMDRGLLEDERYVSLRDIAPAKSTKLSDRAVRIRTAVQSLLRRSITRTFRDLKYADGDAPSDAGENGNYVQVWSMTGLTERDLNIPRGKSTNRTGSINLDKGQLADDIDHRHYFRDEVFPSLNWAESTRGTHLAEADFLLVIKGVNQGMHSLILSHTPRTDTAAYEQRNAMTRLRWGTATELIARKGLLGGTLKLFVSVGEPRTYLISIE